MTSSLRHSLVLSFISLLLLTGFTCSKHVPVNEKPPSVAEPSEVPQEQMTEPASEPIPESTP